MKAVFFLLITLCMNTTYATDFSRVFAKVKDSVVVIHSKESFQKLDQRKGIQSVSSESLGTGVLIDASGKILTAAHVVHQSELLVVITNDGKSYPAEVLSSDQTADIALIRIRDDVQHKFPAAKLGNSDQLKTGEEVFVVGAPYGLEQTLTTGVLSGRRFHDLPGSPNALEFLQTDASVNQGNSGGPLFTLNGHVVGVVSHIATQSGGSEGLGFAASINMVKNLLLNENYVWVGVDFLLVDNTLANILNAPQASGILIQRVARGSLGDKLGFRGGYIDATLNKSTIKLGGDIVLQLGDIDIVPKEGLFQQVREYLRGVKTGTTVTAKVLRNGRVEMLSYTIP